MTWFAFVGGLLVGWVLGRMQRRVDERVTGYGVRRIVAVTTPMGGTRYYVQEYGSRWFRRPGWKSLCSPFYSESEAKRFMHGPKVIE